MSNRRNFLKKCLALAGLGAVIPLIPTTPSLGKYWIPSAITYDEAVICILQGYGISICSNQGFQADIPIYLDIRDKYYFEKIEC